MHLPQTKLYTTNKGVKEMRPVDLFELGMDRKIIPTPHRRKTPPGHRINLGGGSKVMPDGVINIGLETGWDADIDPMPLMDETCQEIYALHFLEHVRNVNYVLAECQRVLAPGGTMHIVVPYGTCHMAVQDLDHKHFFNEDSWRHTFANPYYNPHGDEWLFHVNYNFIMGVKGENLALCTQLIKTTRKSES
jgi:SAM-dependent methyltransferase